MISIIIPCLNERKNITFIYQKLKEILKKQSFEIIFIDDGSTDKSFQEIINLSNKDKKVKGISFTKNFGHQNALKAGFDNAKGSAVITLDADLQHPPELIPKLIKSWKINKSKVVHAVKLKNETSFIRNIFSRVGYFFINKLSSNFIEPGGSDFCLYDKEIVNIIKKFTGSNLMFRSYIKWLGYKKDIVYYKPNKRLYGKSSYNLNQLIEIVRLSVVRFSIRPLRLIMLIGLITIIFVTFFIILELVRFILYNSWPTGLLTILMLQLLFGGFTLFSIGIIGEYLGFLIKETSNNPNYIVEKKINL